MPATEQEPPHQRVAAACREPKLGYPWTCRSITVAGPRDAEVDGLGHRATHAGRVRDRREIVLARPNVERLVACRVAGQKGFALEPASH